MNSVSFSERSVNATEFDAYISGGDDDSSDGF